MPVFTFGPLVTYTRCTSRAICNHHTKVMLMFTNVKTYNLIYFVIKFKKPNMPNDSTSKDESKWVQQHEVYKQNTELIKDRRKQTTSNQGAILLIFDP